MALQSKTAALKQEIREFAKNRESKVFALEYYIGLGFAAHFNEPLALARAYAFEHTLKCAKTHIYENDLIVGSLVGMFTDEVTEEEMRAWKRYTDIAGKRIYRQSVDHYAPAHDMILEKGVPGILAEIENSLKVYANDADKVEFLTSCKIAMEAFRGWILKYAEAAKDEAIRTVCTNLCEKAPETFREALQLVWFFHEAFLYQRLGAMAMGRMDQYLYPYYRHDIDAGILTDEEAQELLENTFMKYYERRVWRDADEVSNIVVAGVTPEGEDATNELTYLILYAVRNCFIPGPNLSARIHEKTPDRFLEEAMKVIGTGLGYPALMNDNVNIAALNRHGYTQEDVNDYCMVGCIENFLAGKQPPWSDSRFDSVKFLEYTLNRGRDMRNDEMVSVDTGDPTTFETMEQMMKAYSEQLRIAAEYHAFMIICDHARVNAKNFVAPFVSCTAHGCIERGLDICNGGTIYPAPHGVCTMGVATVADSLAAIEQCVFVDHSISMETLLKALKANFVGYEEERKLLLAAPKYGNDNDFVDKYAVWFVDYMADLFDQYRLDDGGRFYTAMASNVQNISAGAECAASPDGRLAAEPLSDAASPTYGRDTHGPTFAMASLSKPDYTRCATGSVINQKYSPAMFRGEENIRRMCTLVRVYFSRGGQEVQINSVSRDILKDAMDHPEKYADLVVRVSGFSAFYTKLRREVQLDILSRTEQG